VGFQSALHVVLYEGKILRGACFTVLRAAVAHHVRVDGSSRKEERTEGRTDVRKEVKEGCQGREGGRKEVPEGYNRRGKGRKDRNTYQRQRRNKERNKEDGRIAGRKELRKERRDVRAAGNMRGSINGRPAGNLRGGGLRNMQMLQPGSAVVESARRPGYVRVVVLCRVAAIQVARHHIAGLA
jgi:hypothetical protein